MTELAVLQQRHNRTTPNQAWLRALEMTARIGIEPVRTLPIVIEELAQKFGDAPALLSRQESLSFCALAQAANRYARWALDHGIGVGDCVCLMMPNRPEYASIWLGITRVGGVVALLNTSLTGASLAHSVNVARALHAIVDSSLVDQFKTALPGIEGAIRFWSHGEADGSFARIDGIVRDYSGDSLDAQERRPVTTQQRALYIYTSGTTGLPKAANVSHHRLMMWSHWFAGMMHVRPSDRMYNCLPMYHSIGGVVAVAAMLVGGGSVVVRERFSASQFWSDIVEWDCTLFQYIGELCRYLVNAAPDPCASQHRLRLCCGNGLRADVWDKFAARFNIPQILEFYAATENNFSLFNCDGKPGAVGRVPTFLSHRFNVALLKLDADGREPVRGADGLCRRCAPSEPGEAIGEISRSSNNQAGQFEGYSDKTASERKILRDVFVAGDAWLRTGDLMRQDEKGYFYFLDRIGDTFRWKGENVATSEVADVIAEVPGIIEATVYGVVAPGAEGRAGMATVVTGADFDLIALRNHLIERLPSYARPVFVRIRSGLEVTETFKHRKQALALESFDPDAREDAVYFDDKERQAYVRVDPELYRRIQTQEIRL